MRKPTHSIHKPTQIQGRGCFHFDFLSAIFDTWLANFFAIFALDWQSTEHNNLGLLQMVLFCQFEANKRCIFFAKQSNIDLQIKI